MSNVGNGMSRGVRILLVASLALNVAFVGAIVGVGLKGSGDNRPVRSVEVAVGSLGQALSREDRRRIGDMLREDPAVRQNSRRAMEAQMGEIAELLRAEQFDAVALGENLATLRQRVGLVHDAAANALITVISEMPLEERNALADSIEARLERGHDRN